MYIQQILLQQAITSSAQRGQNVRKDNLIFLNLGHIGPCLNSEALIVN